MSHAAHIRFEGDVQTEQSVLDHLRETAGWSALFGRKIGLESMAYLEALLHDMGKLTTVFDDYIRYITRHPEDKGTRGTVVHAVQGARYALERLPVNDKHACYAAHILAMTAYAHHGGLPDGLTPEGDIGFERRARRDDPKHHYEEAMSQFVESLGAEADAVFVNAAEELAALKSRCEQAGLKRSFALHLIIKYLFSCLIDADRFNTYLFMAGLPADVRETPPPPWPSFIDALEEHLRTLGRNSDIDMLRASISRQCRVFAERGTGVYQLCVPTGGGKTLSSLLFALLHARRHGKERIVYVVPYTSIIDQNARQVRDILKRGELILEHHSNVLPNDEESAEEASARELLTQRWDAPIIFTTMVQFLESLYAGGTRGLRRMHALANSVLIFDEIQSIPPKCIHLFNGAVNFLSRVCGATVVLCTATQPALDAARHPLMLSDVPHMVENADALFGALRRTRVVDKHLDGDYSYDELCDFIMDRCRWNPDEGVRIDSLLAIMNTKRGAFTLYERIKAANADLPPHERFTVCYLSTYMCPSHRMFVLERVREALCEKRRVILVSTQLIEAGVDISFRCAVRAFAGLDSIAQAAGRCNRHGEWPCCDVYIVNARDERISGLPEIAFGQTAAEEVLYELKAGMFGQGADPLSPIVMRRYFKRYYCIVKDTMDYWVKKRGTIMDMLSENTRGTIEFGNRHGGDMPVIKQAFRTAGDHFRVIDDNTEAILTPYGGGAALIAELDGDIGLQAQRDALKRAQRYAVNVYDNVFRRLSGDGWIYRLGCGAWALREEHYDADSGLAP